MSRENVEVVRGIYNAAARREAEAVMAAYDPDIVWDFTRIPERNFIGDDEGIYRGHEGVRKVFRGWYDAWENIEDDCEELIDAGDEQVISVVTRRGRGRASGAEVEAHRAGLWTIRAGKIVHVVWFLSRDDAFEAVGLRE